jgi:hypothetical protein
MVPGSHTVSGSLLTSHYHKDTERITKGFSHGECVDLEDQTNTNRHYMNSGTLPLMLLFIIFLNDQHDWILGFTN